MFKQTVFVFILCTYFGEIDGYANLDWEPSNPAFDQSFYENALNPELCQQQLAYLNNNTLLALEFIESGLRVPRGILMGNTVDWGNYFQCIGINEYIGYSNIEGKFCSITVPFNQSIQLPELPTFPELPEWIPEWLPELIPEWIDQLPEWIHFDPRKLKVNRERAEKLRIASAVEKNLESMNGEISRTEELGSGFTLAVCIPKPCTTKEGIDGLLFNLTTFGFQYKDNYCRLKNDKPWAPADYVAIVIFTLLGLLTLLSTSHDIWRTVIKSDPKSVTPLYKTFSLYTNARRLTTFTKVPGALECVDGIRALAMMWVILGHSFSTLPSARQNLIESVSWTLSLESTWVTAGTISVDTFFMISGMLLVYTTAGKMNGVTLLKKLHLFYLNRLLRMFPLLAAGILVQASLLHYITDGPDWREVASYVENCRNYWWSTLIHLQNFLNPGHMCLPHSWYLAIDIQLYILCPIVLFWVLGRKKKMAWTALFTALATVLIASTIYIFIKEFPGSIIAPARNDEHLYYMHYYYINTLARASPFFVGMIFGYLQHLWRGKTLELTKFATFLLWSCVGIILLGVIFASHPMKDLNWDNQTYDSLINAFHRPIWACGIGIMIFACHHGYGGPLNWFLTLQMWKLPSRLSYGMYIFHYPIMYVTAGTALSPVYFRELNTVYRFFSEFVIALLVSYVMTLFVDSPCSSLIKLLLGGGAKKPQQISEEPKKTGFNGVQVNGFKNKYAIKL